MSSTPIPVRDHRDAIEKGARLGYLARAAVFIVIGYFAFRTAFAGGGTLSEEEAISRIVGSPFGSVMLVLLVIALPLFSFWRFLQAILDADGYGSDAKGLAVRAGRLASGFAYLGLALYAGSLLFGVSTGGGEGGSSILDRWAPLFGPWFTIPAGLVMLGVAASQAKKAWSGDFLRFLSLPARHERWMTAVCRFGLVARGLVFLALAFLLFTGASRWSADHMPGLEDALTAIGSWPYGWLLLSATGLGLVAFGVYALILSRYGHIRSPDLDPSAALARMKG
ncbi:DUF1206 domain-containing protein [Aureimonas sp. ME7]|uniref:DUF1206 domain-containing protein n=1 Tax=Aureimonas sp. ME7 TaxID=2744252 RepID=UPI0015F72023|nr:DUF1206 domain-containing protein [Aureimonas sp. ME7]